MNQLPYVILAINVSPSDIVGWGLLTILSSAGMGYFAGRIISSRGERQKLLKASRNLNECFDLLLQSFRHARQACVTMRDFPELKLSTSQSRQLEAEQSELIRTWQQCWDRIIETGVGDKQRETETDFRRLNWDRAHIDAEMGLPDREALIANLSYLLSLPSRDAESHGLLMLRLDNGIQMKLRFGEENCRRFLKELSTLVEPFVREQDFLCLASSDTLAVLLPALEFQLGRKLAENLRNVIREHRFRLEDQGPEVLVTASLGYAVCYPREHFEIVRQRGENAVAEARRMGRNQLCLHDGSRMILCSNAVRPVADSATLATFAVPTRI